MKKEIRWDLIAVAVVVVLLTIATIMGPQADAGTVTIFNPQTGSSTVCTTSGSGSSTVVICP